MKKKILIGIFIGLVVLALLALLIQLIPYGRNHANPSVIAEPNWDSHQTRELAKRACFDCHSNETVWPWYSNIAPVSWLVYNDVINGRARLNFSEWKVPQREVGEIAEVLQEGEMPPAIYLMMHPSARLTSAERQALVVGLSNSLR